MFMKSIRYFKILPSMEHAFDHNLDIICCPPEPQYFNAELVSIAINTSLPSLPTTLPIGKSSVYKV